MSFNTKKTYCLGILILTIYSNQIFSQNSIKKEEIDKTGASYSQSVKISDYKELLFISGQIPLDEKGKLPTHNSFEEQCRYAWANLIKQLDKANMELKNLVKVTIFLSDRKYRQTNGKIRREILKDLSPALTIIITGIYNEQWLLEIEGVAAK
ncbi:RidA family protein [uncultured Polaribacter sp.]|uniref:RidA family protein n=1 Tax=uncultured Polaribacter sp. TaxID=174711 RepID=UPI00260361A6|nr:RidA family protein [uncultured Polaribacter sp.]